MAIYNLMKKLFLYSSLIFACSTGTVLAAEAWQYCDIAQDADFLPYAEIAGETPVDIKADTADVALEGTSTFTGNVIIEQNGQELRAEHATYNRLTGDVNARDNLQIRDSEMIVNSEQAEWSLDKDEGTLTDTQYRVRSTHARGDADTIHRQGKTTTTLKEATYTTCAESDNAWILKADEVVLNHDEGVGTAEGVVIRLADVPVVYLPYISFPLNDDRKSGFLTPAMGVTDETGFDLRTPFYWNIAPNRDLTITPRFMSRRGLMLTGDYRYLYEQGEGRLNAGFLNNDRQKDRDGNVNPYYDEDRNHVLLRHKGNINSRWSTNVDYNYVSDNAYLEDFGTDLTLASITHLNQELDAKYRGDNWAVTGRVQDYQTLTDVSSPYKRLPQFLFNGALPNKVAGMKFGLTAEYVDFDHDTKVTGQRIDVEPVVSLPWRSSAAFIEPRVALRHTQYELDDKNLAADADDSISRTLPIVSLDSGLFFDRDMTMGSSNYTHTLEPRAFYLYVPEENQDDIPDFDSGDRTFNMNQLFSYNRFSGRDRIGDANQMTLALTSRIISQETGREKFRFTFGQIQYFSDREVNLSSSTAAQTRSNSDMVVEMVASIAEEWTLRSEVQWDAYSYNSNMSNLQLRYQSDNGKLLNFAHRYRRDDVTSLEGLEQVDISTRLPIGKKWSVVGRWYHSLKYNQTVEGLAGVEYQSCCWSSRLVVRNYVNDVSDDDRNLAIFFQIELKGLGMFGQKSDSLLESSILGYRDL